MKKLATTKKKASMFMRGRPKVSTTTAASTTPSKRARVFAGFMEAIKKQNISNKKRP